MSGPMSGQSASGQLQVAGQMSHPVGQIANASEDLFDPASQMLRKSSEDLQAQQFVQRVPGVR